MTQIDIEEAIANVAKEVDVQSQRLDHLGREIPNSVPLAPPVGYKRPISVADQIRDAIRQASFEAAAMGAETEEEANDFDVGEDMDLSSPFEHDFEVDPALEAMLAIQSRPPAKPSQTAAPSNSVQPPVAPSGDGKPQ